MKKLLFSVTFILTVSVVFIMITAQKIPDKRKFYYAFNEKIFIDEIADKYVVKFKNKKSTIELKSVLIAEVGNDKNIQDQNETTITIDVKNSAKNIDQLLSGKMMDIELIKPAYKYKEQQMYYTNEILVEPNDGLTIYEVIKKNGLEASAKVKEGKFYSIIEIASSYDACEIANKIQESGLVKYSHPNFMMPIQKSQVIPNDTYFNNQYYLRNTGQIFNPIENHAGTPGADINATWAWPMTTGNNNIIVAVIDEGVTPDHPDLPNTRQVRLNGSNFVPGENVNDPTPGLNDNHGNACAGIIAATQNNNEGVSGVAPNVRIMPIKIFGQNNQADNNGTASAIDFAWQNGADVISNSWGFPQVDNPNYVPVIVAAINRAVTLGRGNLGCVVTFSAGNTALHFRGGNGIVGFPSNVQINGVLTIGASDRNDKQADYSPSSNVSSPNNQIIDIVAPSHKAYPPTSTSFGTLGETLEIWTIDIPGSNGYNPWNIQLVGPPPALGETLPTTGTNNLSYTGRVGGTSAACPQIAAVAALILSLNNTLTQQQVFDIITKSADKVGGYAYNANGWSLELGNGRLNACAALNSIPNLYSITANGPLCTNSTATYTVDGLPPGSTVSWTSSNNNIATISAGGIASWVSSGTVVFTATINIPNRCGIAISNKSVIVGNSIIGDNAVCGQSNIYTITNLPAGASVNWQAAPNQIVTINSPNSTQTTLTSYSDGVITLTATISNGCAGSISKANISVTGPPTITCQTIGNGYCNQQINLCPSQLNSWQYFSIPNYNPAGATGFQLTASGGGYFSDGTTVKNITTDYWATHDIGVYVSNNCDVTVRPVNNCGVSVYIPYVVSFRVMSYGCTYSYSVSPNPASSTITVSPNTKISSTQKKAEKASFTEIDILDKQGNFKKRLKFAKGTTTATIDISFLPTDTYVVRVFNGTNWEEYKIIVAK